MLIKEATNTDLQEINSLYRDLHPEEYDPNKPISDIYSSKAVPTTFIIEEEGAVVGFMLLLVITYWDFTYAEIQELFVAPKYRRRGFAIKLINKAIVCARALNAQVVIVSTNQENNAAKAVYSKAGFAETAPGHFKLKL